jgi:cell division protein FtsQ
MTGICLVIFLIYRIIVGSDSDICKDVRIKIIPDAEIQYISSEEIKLQVSAQYPELLGTQISQIEIDKIKNIISENLFVSDVRVYKSLDAEIIAEVKQREPIVRVFTSKGKAFMLDRQGFLMPVPDWHGCPLLCAGGNIVLEPDSFFSKNIQNPAFAKRSVFSILNSIYLVTLALNSDNRFNDLISQIYVNEQNEIELIPVFGDFIVFLGLPEQIPEKLERLYIFYTKLFPYIDMSIYKQLNLTIANQLILTKK